MIIRQAHFWGRVNLGQDAAFRAYVAERLLPLWLKFPMVREVRVLYEVTRDDGADPLPLVLTMAFDDDAALAIALASPERAESRVVTQGLLAMFDGHIHHHILHMAEPLHRPA
ncbi:MAG: hypothetical protein CVT71_01420 [Alphaproteobacteria bacterium HGW-Alphaproteobacteria-10]|jgi:hypothetical protein|nr:MAG: hypothetical protein CVT71_01420 [Alphaproteobacteria bacterium HGW-Alphaproteobacteria-10]